MGGRAGDPGALLVQRWDELLRLVPPDMGLLSALGQVSQRQADDPISWLSATADIPRKDLDQARLIRNQVGGNRPVAGEVVSGALKTVDHALAVVGRFHMPH